MNWPHFARRCRVCGDQLPNCCARRETKDCKAAASALFRSSFLAPLVIPEAASGKVAAFVRRLPAEEFTVSHWTRVEFSSLIAREVRMGGLDVQAATRADARFEAMVDESFSVLLPNADDFALARRYLGRFETRLRAGDALHLAVANNHRASMIYSLDKILLNAGKILDLPASMGIRTK